MKEVYLIIQEAVYRHCIIGVFSTEANADKAFKDLYDKEAATEKSSKHNNFDGHHDYYLHKMPLNQVYEGLSGEENSPLKTYSYDKIDGSWAWS